MSKSEVPALRANQARLAETLHESCQFGAAHPYGRCVNLLPIKTSLILFPSSVFLCPLVGERG
jgi:hypothetical protein